MRKINSIGYGATILKFGLIFTTIVPLLLYTISKSLNANKIFLFLIKISVVIGISIFLSLCILLNIELKQDKKINAFYERNRNRKIKISENYFECQNCGNQKIKLDERFCSVCGIKLQ